MWVAVEPWSGGGASDLGRLNFEFLAVRPPMTIFCTNRHADRTNRKLPFAKRMLIQWSTIHLRTPKSVHRAYLSFEHT
jgi:hypothetical protein